MHSSKYFSVIAVLLLAATASAGDGQRFEKRTWRVQPRGSQVPVEVDEEFELSTTAQQPLEEELHSPQPLTDDDETGQLPPWQLVNFESIAAALPVQLIYDFVDTNPGHCDELNCDDLVCDCVDCGPYPSGRLWARADYLYWWLDGASVPPLVTTSSAGTDRLDAGVLGLSTTSILVGGHDFGDEGISGGRIEIGRCFPGRDGLGWHFAYFGFDEADDRFQFDSNSVAILARPFFAIEPSSVGPNAELIAFPDEVEGNVSVAASTSFDAAELLLRWSLIRCPDRHLNFVAGYQYSSLDDDLAIRDFKEVIGTSSGLAIGTTLRESDLFQTENRFHGAALGLFGAVCHRRWSVDYGMNLAIGNTHHETRINGSATSTVPVVGGPDDVETTVGGLLAQGTNIGTYKGDAFAVMPQLHVGVGYQVRPRLRALFGYRFLYWSQVARAAEQIDPGVNLSQLDPTGLTGEPRPRFDLRLSDFWAQGMNVGLDYRF